MVAKNDVNKIVSSTFDRWLSAVLHKSVLHRKYSACSYFLLRSHPRIYAIPSDVLNLILIQFWMGVKSYSVFCVHGTIDILRFENVSKQFGLSLTSLESQRQHLIASPKQKVNFKQKFIHTFEQSNHIPWNCLWN